MSMEFARLSSRACLCWVSALACAWLGLGASLADAATGTYLERLDAAVLLSAEGEHRVALPRTWVNQQRGAAAYRLALDPPADRSHLSVHVEASTLPFEVWADGRRVYATYQDNPFADPPLRSWRMAQMFDLPPGESGRAPRELILIAWGRDGSFGGLAPVWVGDRRAIERVVLLTTVRDTIGPLVIAAVIAVLGMFALILARSGRDRTLFMLFGVGALAWAVQTGLTLLPERPLPLPAYRVLWYSLYVGYAVALSVFCVRFTGQRWPAFERAAWMAALGVPLLVPVLGWIEEPAWIYGAVLGVAIAFAVVALGVVVRHAFATWSFDAWLLLGAGTLSVVFAINDWVEANLLGTLVRPYHLVPYAGLAFILLAGWMLVARYQRTASAYESLSAQLEGRVAAGRAELTLQLAEVRAARDAAEQANVAKSRFFAAASHDLRQPLHSLGLYASALEPHLTTPEARELAGRMGQSVESLDSLFDELLDLSRLDAGIIELKPGPVALEDSFQRLDREFQNEAQARGLRLRFVPTRALAWTDPVLIERVLGNLVSNALRYTRRGGVIVGVRRRGGALVLEVIDSGVGIAPADRARVFDEFYQVGNPARDRQRGLGLGLAIVRRLCDLLGHRIELDSQPGRGTRFRVWLPLSALPPPTLAPPPAQVPAAVRGLEGRRVLLVDDEREIREASARVLAQWGADARAAAGRAEAEAAMASGWAPEIAVVDLRLANGEDGMDLVHWLRAALRPDLPAVLISGDTDASQLARVRASRLPLLTKPVSAAKLRLTLLALLDA
jgi:signal transduction histidine kinase/CheY-like chemotaxis protein